MSAPNRKEIEVHCPVCRQLFRSEEEMLKHYDTNHAETTRAEEVGEEVAGAIYVSETSFFGGVNFYLILTSSKILAANAKPSISSIVSPFLGDIPSMVIIGRTKPDSGKQVNRLTPSIEKAILEDDSKNFILLNSEVSKVVLRKHGQFRTGELRITTVGQKRLNFRLVMLPTARETTFDIYRKLLQSTMGEKLSVVE